MGWPQIVFGSVLVTCLLILSLFYTWRQLVALRSPVLADNPSPEAIYERARAWRRLICSGLIFVMGVLLAGALLFLEKTAQRLADQREAEVDNARAEGVEPPPLTPEQLAFARLYIRYWLIFMALLFAVVLLAALDMYATRRYAYLQHRRIQDDRRAMIERQADRIRRERNGNG